MSYSVIITGGTGSFGKAFTKYLLDNSDIPRIVIYSRDEHKQERMAEEFKSDRLRFFIGDVRDKERLHLAVQECTHIVHAAALKIVPAGEYNPMEFVKTNVLGAQNLVDVTVGDRHRYYGKILVLSTDKAVNPVNLYGATKLCMEKLIIASNNLVGSRNIMFSVVRYGNVANSNGSVIQKFSQQVKAGLPLTITDPEMTRYWITLEEASKFVFDKLRNMEAGKVYIPDMPSFKLEDLAAAFADEYIRLPNPPIKIIGIREGEKKHEQIDDNRYSNTNDIFMCPMALRKKLVEMGVLTNECSIQSVSNR